MKCLSLWQPWATAIAVGSKRIETRDWQTHYRGPIAIHAAQRRNKSELIHYGCCWNWCGALAPIGKRMGDNKYLWDLMPFGAIVAVAQLVDCAPTGTFTVEELDTPRFPYGELSRAHDWTERQMGNYELGRFGWVLASVRPLPQPLPWKGARGLFDVSADAI